MLQQQLARRRSRRRLHIGGTQEIQMSHKATVAWAALFLSAALVPALALDLGLGGVDVSAGSSGGGLSVQFSSGGSSGDAAVEFAAGTA